MHWLLSLLLQVPVPQHIAPPLPPKQFGTTRFVPADIMGNASIFSVAGAAGQMPVATGAVLRFASNQPVGVQSAIESVLSKTSFQGDVQVDVYIVDILRHPATSAYEASPALVFTGANYNQTAAAGARTQNVMRMHSTINYTWWNLQTFSNDTDIPASGVGYQCPGARFGATTLRLVRHGRFVWGGIYTGNTTGPMRGWWGAEANINSPTQQPQWISAVPGPVNVGFEVQSDYTHEYRVDIAAIDIRADSDGDGLSDTEESVIGSSITRSDSDADNVDDWKDLLPLDPSVGELNVAIFQNGSAAAALGVKITAINASAHIIINNSANMFVAPGCMHIPFLRGTDSCVTVLGEGRILSCSANATVCDTVDIAPYGRRAYSLSRSAWDGIVVDTSSIVFSASWSGSTVHSAIDLHKRIVSVLPGTEVRGFEVSAVGMPHIFSAAIQDGRNLVVSARGTKCGTANVSLQVHFVTRERFAVGSTVLVQIPVRKLGEPGLNKIVNGNFSGNVTSSQFGPTITGWESNTWNGLFALEKCPMHVAYGKDSDCILFRGYGPGKFGLIQEIALEPGAYSLSAAIASVELEPGQWEGTTSIYASFADSTGPVRPDFAGNGTDTTHDLLSGSSGWRHMNATFTVPSAANITLYFFIWGSGWFFLEDVQLKALPCHAPVTDSLIIGDELALLQYSIPLSFEDTLMCGYCNDTAHIAFNNTELCTKCATTDLDSMLPNKQSATTKILTNFSKDAYFVPDQRMWRMNANGTACLFAGDYMSHGSEDHPEDWSSYSFLSIEVHNPNTQPQSFSVELRDVATVDYWSRVNWYSAIPPGKSTFTMPIDVYVGEKSEIKIRRRIDLKHITRLAISNTGPMNISLSNLSLIPESNFQFDFPKLLKIDVQPRTGPVLNSFTGLYPDTQFETRRAYGIVNQSTICQNQDREHPDDLFRDWVAFSNGGLDFGLPGGSYGIWFVMEDAGYWEYYQNYKKRMVTVSGGESVVETMNVDEFWKRYYTHANDEDLPGQSSWHRYIKPRYLQRARFLQATITDEQPLSLRFSSADMYGCTLSALLIWPMELNATATKFLGELQDRLRDQYNRNYLQVLPPPRGTPIKKLDKKPMELKERLTFFAPPITETIEANSNPLANEILSSARGDLLNTTVAANAQAVKFICFVDSSPSAESIQLTNVQLHNLGRLTSTVYVVRYKQKRLTADGAVWANKPRLLVAPEKIMPLPVTNVTRCLWIEIHGAVHPADRLIVQNASISFTFGPSGTVAFPFRVTELPVALPSAAPLWIGYLGMLPTYPQADWPEVRTKQLAELQPSLQLMQRLGFSAATGGAGGPDVDNETLADLSFSSFRDIFGDGIPVNSYGGSAITNLNTRDGRTTNYLEKVKKDLLNISAHAKALSWPEFYQTCGDEPQGDAITASLAVGAAFGEARKQLPADSVIGKTSVFTSVLNVSSDPTAQLLGENSSIDLIILNEHSGNAIRKLQASGHEWMLYNGGSRFRVGFYLAMASHLHGCKGLYNFAFSSVGADPYYALDAREDDLCAAYTSAPEGTLDKGAASDLVLLLETVQVLREGVNDLRYTSLLRNLVFSLLSCTSTDSDEKHDRMQGELRSASAVLAEIDSIPLGSQAPQWSAAKITAVRSAVEAAIARLLGLQTELCRKTP